jgi:RNA polymerase sigma factor (sigma-70 family)
MSADGLRAVFRRLRRLTDPGSTGLSDAELLQRYSSTRDEAAFELLLWRHGPMVHGVCRRLLRRTEDADDAFQATFLTLVRKARTVRRGAAVGAWLYQVAYRVALRARASVAPREQIAVEPEAAPTGEEASWRDLSPVLDEEVRRLPARYRAPVILCYLEGRTHAEAARELGCPKGTVAVRLMRARKLLQTRLTRRGVTIAGGLVVAALAPPASAALVANTLRIAFGSPVAVRITTLSDGVIRAMSFARLKATAAVLLLTTGILAAGTTLMNREAPPPSEAPPAEPVLPQSPPASAEKKPQVIRVPSMRDGQVLVIGTEMAPNENVPADRRVTATVGYLLVPVANNEELKPDEVIQGSNNSRWRKWRDGDELRPGKVYVHKVKKVYKRLEVGDEVQAGQTVALVDPVLALN